MATRPLQEAFNPLEEFVIRINASRVSTKRKEALVDALTFLLRPRCWVCQGFGHVYTRCSTMRVIRRNLKRTGRYVEWEALQDYIRIGATAQNED